MGGRDNYTELPYSFSLTPAQKAYREQRYQETLRRLAELKAEREAKAAK